MEVVAGKVVQDGVAQNGIAQASRFEWCLPRPTQDEVGFRWHSTKGPVMKQRRTFYYYSRMKWLHVCRANVLLAAAFVSGVGKWERWFAPVDQNQKERNRRRMNYCGWIWCGWAGDRREKNNLQAASSISYWVANRARCRLPAEWLRRLDDLTNRAGLVSSSCRHLLVKRISMREEEVGGGIRNGSGTWWLNGWMDWMGELCAVRETRL